MATNIPSTPADGNIKTVLVPAVADLKAPTLTELNAPEAIDISCYLVRNGFALTVDQQIITDERECDRIVRQRSEERRVGKEWRARSPRSKQSGRRGQEES